jgi:hypothetical protein
MSPLDLDAIKVRIAAGQYDALDDQRAVDDIDDLIAEVEALRVERDNQAKAANHWFEQAQADHNRAEHAEAELARLRAERDEL